MNSSTAEQSTEGRYEGKPHRRTNWGCWILGGIGCFVFVVMLTLFLFFFLGIAALGADMGSVSEEILYEGSENKIAVIRIEGVITEESLETSLLSVGGATTDAINSHIETAINDNSVKGILLRMNTPGGEVVASDLIHRKVLEARESKPVVTWMSGTAASGGYLIAAGSDKIVAHPSTITGSIGVILEITNLAGLYEKLGIDSRIFKSGEFKDDEGVFDEDEEGEADQIMQALVDESYESFIEIISEGRQMEISEVRELADGRVYTGSQASENGLVDELGTMDDAINVMEELAGRSNMTVVEYTSGGFWDSFYEYQSLLLSKIGFLPGKNSIGVQQYYLLDI